MQVKEYPSRALPKKTGFFPHIHLTCFALNSKGLFMKALKKIGFVLLGIVSLLALLCSIAASCVTNSALMEQGFLSYADTAHLNLSPTRYAACAKGICAYLDGQTNEIAHPDDPAQSLFSEDEMLHLADVLGIVNGLKMVRWIGGGLALLCIAAAWLFSQKKEGSPLMRNIWQGFAWASGILFTLAAGLCIWALADFNSLFLAFHHVAFTNDLWLMNPQTDLMIALMPEGFFMWYGGEMLKSLLPIFGIMLCLIISWLKVGRKETEGTKDAK